jgi:hypothetical protein
LKSENDSSVRRGVIYALGEIGDESAEKPLCQALKEDGFCREAAAKGLEKLGWMPKNNEERAFYYMAKKPWNEIIQFGVGESARETILNALINNPFEVEFNSDLYFNERVLFSYLKDGPVNEFIKNLLNKKGIVLSEKSIMKKITTNEYIWQIVDGKQEYCIKPDWIYYNEEERWTESLTLYKPEIRNSAQRTISLIEIRSSGLKKIFVDYTDLILDVSVIRFINRLSSREQEISYEYFLNLSNDALKQICTIKTKTSNNILQLISKRRDVNVVMEISCWRNFCYGDLSFDEQRKIAKDELEKRGNPPYDPSIYLRDEEWKI